MRPGSSWGVSLLAWALGALVGAADPAPGLKFSFGTGRPAPGFTAVTADARHGPGARFGFEPGARIQDRKHGVTSEEPFLFSVDLGEGNYVVTLMLGDDTAESRTTVKAEARRLMLEDVPSARGESVTRTCTVNIRTPLLGDGRRVRLKQREKDSETVTWDEALTLEFNGTRPSLRTLEIVPAPTAPTLFIAGDSTVCDQPAEPWNSWGQMLPRFLMPGVAVANYAQSGESIKSSLGARRFEKIFRLMKPGDWLLVQFGHNDMKDRAPDALAAYRANLRSIVARTRAKGGTPVLLTSMERKAGVKAPTLAGYPDAVRAVAREDKVAIIDLHDMSLRLYRALGKDLGKAFQDGTHHNNYGSYELAKCVAAGMAGAEPGLAALVVEDVKEFDPSRPDPVAHFHLPPSPDRSTQTPDGD